MTLMTVKELALIGLALNMAGVLLLFFFGFPQPDLSEAVTIEVEDNTVFTDGTSASGLKENARRKKRFYKTMSSVALLLLLIGFIFQALSVLKGN